MMKRSNLPCGDLRRPARILLLGIALTTILLACSGRNDHTQDTQNSIDYSPYEAGYSRETELYEDEQPEHDPSLEVQRVLLSEWQYSIDPTERSVYNTVMPFLDTNALMNLSYPNFVHEQQFRLLWYVLHGIQRGNFSSPFEVVEASFGRVIYPYFDQEIGIHALPREVFDPIVARHLYSPDFDYTFLIERGFMSEDELTYTLNIDGLGGGAFYFIGDLYRMDDELIKLRLDVHSNIPIPRDEDALYVFFLLRPTEYEFLQIVQVFTGPTGGWFLG